MKSIVQIAIVSVGLGVAAVSQAASSAAVSVAAASRYRIEASCYGTTRDVEVYVYGNGRSHVLYIYENGEQTEAAWAEKRLIESDVSTSVGYAVGNVLHGGADLRILVQHDRAPALEGHGNLTRYRNNAGLDCDIY